MKLINLLETYNKKVFVLSRILNINNHEIGELVDNLDLNDQQFDHYESIDNRTEAIVTILETYNLYSDAAAALA